MPELQVVPDPVLPGQRTRRIEGQRGLARLHPAPAEVLGLPGAGRPEFQPGELVVVHAQALQDVGVVGRSGGEVVRQLRSTARAAGGPRGPGRPADRRRPASDGRRRGRGRAPPPRCSGRSPRGRRSPCRGGSLAARAWPARPSACSGRRWPAPGMPSAPGPAACRRPGHWPAPAPWPLGHRRRPAGGCGVGVAELGSRNARPRRASRQTAVAAIAMAAATAGRRRAHFQPRSQNGDGRAAIGSPARWRRRSSASASAVAYRRAGAFSRHFRQIVSRSRGRPGWSRDGGTGSMVLTCSRVSRAVAARNGGRPVSSS